MPTRDTLARRLREARQKRGLTLKEVERLSGFSSTHISEIERGRTTPTVDALVRIAAALQKDPCYFLEDRVLGEIAFTSANGDGAAVLEGAGRLEPLTPGVLGGHLEITRLKAAQPCSGCLSEVPPGDLCLHVVAGDLRITSEDAQYELRAGASLHARFAAPPRIAVKRAPAELLIVRAPAVGPVDGDFETV